VVIECATEALRNEPALVVLDGWNATVKPISGEGAAITVNNNAQVDHWPHTGLRFQSN